MSIYGNNIFSLVNESINIEEEYNNFVSMMESVEVVNESIDDIKKKIKVIKDKFVVFVKKCIFAIQQKITQVANKKYIDFWKNINKVTLDWDSLGEKSTKFFNILEKSPFQIINFTDYRSYTDYNKYFYYACPGFASFNIRSAFHDYYKTLGYEKWDIYIERICRRCLKDNHEFVRSYEQLSKLNKEMIIILDGTCLRLTKSIFENILRFGEKDIIEDDYVKAYKDEYGRGKKFNISEINSIYNFMVKYARMCLSDAIKQLTLAIKITNDFMSCVVE